MSDFRQKESFQSFVMDGRKGWMRLAYRVLGNREEAEDVVQETLAVLSPAETGASPDKSASPPRP